MIGSGATSQVYLALDLNSLIERHVAIKFYNEKYLISGWSSIEKEIKILNMIDHCGVVKLYESGCDG